MISLIITAVLGIATALLVLVGVLSGRKRGMKRQIVKTATIILAALVALLVARIASGIVIDAFGSGSGMSKDILEAIGIDVGNDATALDSLDARYLVAIPVAFIIAPLVFFLTYLLLHFILKIPAFFVCKLLKIPKKASSTKDRLIGMAIGLVQGVLVAAILFCPITGLLNTVDEAFEPMYETDSESVNEAISTYETDIQPITDNFMVNFLGAMGGNLLYDGISTVSIGDNSYNMSNEIAAPIVKIALKAEELDNMDLTKLEDEEKDAINEIIDTLSESKYLSSVMSDLLIVFTDSLKDSDDIAGDANLKEVTNATLDAIGNMAKENKEENNLADNITTITDVYFMLSDYDVLTSIKDNEKSPVDALLEVVEVTADGKKVTVMSKAAAVFNENEHTVPIVTALTKISVASLANRLNADEDITVIYEDVKAGFHDITKIDRELDKDTYVAEVSAKLEETLASSGIELGASVIDGMANHVYENYDEIFADADTSADGELSDQEMNDIMLSYYEVYLETVEADAE